MWQSPENARGSFGDAHTGVGSRPSKNLAFLPSCCRNKAFPGPSVRVDSIDARSRRFSGDCRVNLIGRSRRSLPGFLLFLSQNQQPQTGFIFTVLTRKSVA
jgi:hypothetical protein